MSFVVVDPALNGWKLDPEKGTGEPGLIVAFRRDGEEALFLPCSGYRDKLRRPLEWVPTTSVTLDPEYLCEPPEDEEEPYGGETDSGKTTARIKRREV
jgi:hypothetical protein